MNAKRDFLLSAGLITADPDRAEASLSQLCALCRPDYLHVDIMDGDFVPGMMMSTGLIKRLHQLTDLPLHLHFLTREPERKLRWFTPRAGDLVTFHAEATYFPAQVLKQLKELGAIPSVALNPSTPLDFSDKLWPEVENIHLMAIKSGYPDHLPNDAALDKFRRLRKMLDEAGHSAITITAEGGVTAGSAALFLEAGADMLTVSAANLPAVAGLPEN